MKKFIAELKERTPHERRGFAARASGLIVVILFVGWLGSLGTRLAAPGPSAEGENALSQTAAVINGLPYSEGGNTLEVSTTTDYRY